MENQHRKISGYRELSQEEIDLMNEIKALGPKMEILIEKIQLHIDMQYAAMLEDPSAVDPLDHATPLRWLNIGKTELQQGLMALTRSVAQPKFF